MRAPTARQPACSRRLIALPAMPWPTTRAAHSPQPLDTMDAGALAALTETHSTETAITNSLRRMVAELPPRYRRAAILT